MRELLDEMLRRGEAHLSHKFFDRRPDLSPRAREAMQLQRPGKVVLDAVKRVQRGERILEYQLHLAHVSAEGRAVAGANVLSVQPYLTVGRRVKPGQQP